MSPIIEVVAPRLLGPAVMVAAALIVKGYTDVGDGFSAGVIVALAIALRYLTLGPERAERSLPILRYAPAISAVGLLVALGVGFAGSPSAIRRSPCFRARRAGRDHRDAGADQCCRVRHRPVPAGPRGHDRAHPSPGPARPLERDDEPRFAFAVADAVRHRSVPAAESRPGSGRARRRGHLPGGDADDLSPPA